MARNSKRRKFNAKAAAKGLVALSALATFTSLSAQAAPNPAAEASDPKPERPNIIIIMADDMGFSDIGPYGGEIRTPNLSRLASNGVKFTQFYNTARCCPTRAALLTGLYPHQAGMGHMTGFNDAAYWPGYRGELSHDAVTIPEVLKTAGYRTYMTGKWHVTGPVRPRGDNANWPRQRGFDRYYGMLTGGGSYYDPQGLFRDNTPLSAFADPEYKPKGQYYFTDAIGDHSVRFLNDHARQNKEQPFFMYVAFTAPHWPIQAPADVVARYKGWYDKGYDPIRKARFARQQASGLIEKEWALNPTVGDWASMPDKEWNARCMEVYAAMVERMDTNIGNIVDTLKRNGQLDNTLIMFLSDNGACAEPPHRRPAEDVRPGMKFPPQPLTFHQNKLVPVQTRDGRPVLRGPDTMPGPETSYIDYGRNWANVSNTPFKEYKHWVHEGGISSPLIAHWPKGIKRHDAWERQPGHLIDLMATCVDLSGAKYPARYNAHTILPMEGVSLAPAFAGQPLDRKAPIFWEHEGNRAVRDGEWKLVAKGIDGPWELYNMKADRTETQDLSAKQPERVKAMSDAWGAWAKRAQVLPMPWHEKPQQKEPPAF